MQIFIPEIGSKLKLINDFKFTLYNDINRKDENTNFIKKLGLSIEKNNIIILPKDTILTIKKYNIKVGYSHHSRIYVRINKNCSNNILLESSNFWIALNEINKLEFEFLESNSELVENLYLILNELRNNMCLENFRLLESFILERKNIATFVSNDNTFDYLNKKINKMEDILNLKKKYWFSTDLYKENFKFALSVLSKYVRKLKISKL